MFVGHYAPALVAKAIEPKVPLWMLFLGVQLVDVAWAVLVLVGLERVRLDPSLASNPLDLQHVPYTHSLVATVCWAGATFAVTRRRLGRRGALVLAVAVASHWFADLVVHRPDLPLLWGEPKLGMSLWNLPWLAFALEVGLVLAATWWCIRNGVAARPRTLVVLAALLALVQTVLAVGAQPTTVAGTVGGALAAYLVIAAAAWGLERPQASDSARPQAV